MGPNIERPFSLELDDDTVRRVTDIAAEITHGYRVPHPIKVAVKRFGEIHEKRFPRAGLVLVSERSLDVV